MFFYVEESCEHQAENFQSFCKRLVEEKVTEVHTANLIRPSSLDLQGSGFKTTLTVTTAHNFVLHIEIEVNKMGPSLQVGLLRIILVNQFPEPITL